MQERKPSFLETYIITIMVMMAALCARLLLYKILG
jgi:hypothetical protein